MSKTLKVLSLAILLSSVGVVAVADHHEEPSVYVWINFMQAKPGQGEALVELMMTEDAKSFDPLVESGAALDWGIAMPVVHDGGSPGMRIEWVSFVGWAAVDQFMAGFMASQQAMGEEQMEALEAKWEGVVEYGSHADMINRSVHLGQGAPARPGYIHLAYWTAKPGKAREAKAFYDEFAVPIYDQLVADGSIQNYGLHVPAVHRGQEWTHMGWYMSTNLAARDVVGNAFDAADAARSEEDNDAMMGRLMEIFEPDHIDEILLVAHHKMGSSGAE